MNKFKLGIIGLLLIIYQYVAFASVGSYGVTGELKENYYISSFNDNYSYFINPARLVDIDQTTIVLYGAPKVVGEANLLSTSIAIPLYINHTVGLGYIQNGISSIELINQVGNVSGYADFSSKAVYLSYAWRVLPFLSVGGNVTAYNKIVTDIFNSKWSGGLDLGVVFNPFDIYNRGYSFLMRGKLDIGLTLKNVYFLPLKYADGSTENVPLNAIVGLHYGWRRLFDFNITSEFKDLYWSKNEDFKGNAKKISYNLNSELRIQVHKLVGVKAGWVNDGIKGGLDFSYKRLNVFRYLELNYDLIYKPVGHIFVNNFKLVTRVGPTREEMNARRLFDILKLAPNDLYERALAKYKQKMYWEASWLFAELVSKYPRFYKIDAATYYLGSSYEKLELNDLARDVYTAGLNQYKTSEYRGYYLLGLENLAYKDGQYQEVEAKYNEIASSYPDDVKLLSAASYIYGQALLYQEKYDEAETYFLKVDKTSDEYLYAQYSLGVIAAVKANKVLSENPNAKDAYQNAKKYFQNVINVQTTDKAIIELQNKANLLMGHILQEEGRVKEALMHYFKITPEFKDYDQALVAAAWAFLKYKKTTEAINNCDNLIANFPKSRFVPEAYLVKGYAKYLEGKYDEAINNFDDAIKLANQLSVDEKEKSEMEVKYREAKGKLLELEETLKNVAIRRTEFATPAKQQEMLTQYKSLIEVKQNYVDFMEYLENIKKFNLEKEQIILRNATLTRGSANQMLQKMKEERAKQEAQKKIERTEEKIKQKEQEEELLKQQLENLE